MNYICQLNILVIVVFFYGIIELIKVIIKNKGRKKVEKTQKVNKHIFDSIIVFLKKVIFMDIIPWIFITIMFVLFTNIIFVYCFENCFVIESLLDYKDVQLMIFSLIPTIAIAYFQYKIQKRSDDEQKRKDKWHIEELRYERIKDIYSSLHLSGFAVNLNIKNSIGRYSEYKCGERKDAALYIEINPTYFAANDKCFEFFPGYFKVDLKKISIDDTEVFDNNVTVSSIIHTEVDKKWLKFWFNQKNICDNFVYPITKDNKKIHCKIEVFLEDLTLEKDYLKFTLSVEFDMEPNSSCDEYGLFTLGVNNMEMRVLN